MSTTVSIVRCPEYREELVYKSIVEALDLLGGIKQFYLSGRKSALKAEPAHRPAS